MTVRQSVPGFLGIFHMILTGILLFLVLALTGASARTALFLGLFLAVPRLMTSFLIFSLVLDQKKVPVFKAFLLSGAAVEAFLALAVYFFDYASIAGTAGILFGISGGLLTLSLPVGFCIYNLILAVYLLSYKGSSDQTGLHNEHYLPEFRETVIEE